MSAYRDGMIAGGTRNQAIVAHDDWCMLIRGLGACNCNPDIEIVTPREGGVA